MAKSIEKQNWQALNADGEYFDFGKYDFAGAESEMMGGKSPSAEIKIIGKLPKGVSAIPLSEISKSTLSLAESSPRLSDIKHDKISLWAQSYQNSGMAIHAKEKAEGQVIVEVGAPSHSSSKFTILAGKGAKLSIVLKFGSIASGKSSPAPVPLRHDLIEVHLSEDSSLSLTTIQSYEESGASFTHIRAALGRFSHFNHLAGNFGASESRLRVENHMQGAYSRANSLQAFFSEGKQFSDVRASTYHHVPDTTGEMLARGALTGTSRCAYKGYIKIDEGARNTITHQGGTALLLSPNAAANVMPALDVENNEVEAGHGAAVGELSQEEMFYLRSRGLSEEDARILIVEGYFKSLLASHPDSAGREAVSSLISSRLSRIKNADSK